MNYICILKITEQRGVGGSILFPTPTPPPTRCKVEPRFSCEEIVAYFKLFFFPHRLKCIFKKRYFLHIFSTCMHTVLFWFFFLKRRIASDFSNLLEKNNTMEKKIVNNKNLFAKISGLYLNYKTITKVHVLPCLRQ